MKKSLKPKIDFLKRLEKKIFSICHTLFPPRTKARAPIFPLTVKNENFDQGNLRPSGFRGVEPGLIPEWGSDGRKGGRVYLGVIFQLDTSPSPPHSTHKYNIKNLFYSSHFTHHKVCSKKWFLFPDHFFKTFFRRAYQRKSEISREFYEDFAEWEKIEKTPESTRKKQELGLEFFIAFFVITWPSLVPTHLMSAKSRNNHKNL